MIPTTNGGRFEHLIGLARNLEKAAHRYDAYKKLKALQLAAVYRDMAFAAMPSAAAVAELNLSERSRLAAKTSPHDRCQWLHASRGRERRPVASQAGGGLMTADLARPLHVRAYRQYAGTIEYRHGRYAIFAADCSYLGTRRSREAAAYVLEQNTLRLLYRREPAEPEWPAW
jgi:hypothetical protein